MQQSEARKAVYLAGKITGDPCYFTKFLQIEKELEALGYAVFNPARLPQGCLPWISYMRICFAMIDECSAVFSCQIGEKAVVQHGSMAMR